MKTQFFFLLRKTCEKELTEDFSETASIHSFCLEGQIRIMQHCQHNQY